ncbi:hypothetical protein [Candidatus Spongiihabitans sp.]|uniref:hypothetical protein n=1 Tax=Candidatus Spongiihabitans sp. TaxID=3101308 RepID=UPI003C79C230
MNKVTTEILSRPDLLTDCERSVRYHQARARSFNTRYLLIQFIVFALAGANVVHLIEAWLPEWSAAFLWAAVSVLALCGLVFNPVEKHTLHKSLYHGFTVLHGKIMANPNADDKMLTEWTKEIHSLYADEPPVYRALLAHCDNQVAIALGADKGFFVKLKWHQLLFRNFWPFQGAEFLNQNQVHQQ